MLLSKFITLTGCSLTVQERIKMFTIFGGCSRTMSEEEFCELWKAGDFRALLDVVAKERKLTEEAYGKALEKLRKTQFERGNMEIGEAEFLLEKAEQYKDAEMRERAVSLIGERDVIFMKNVLKLPLWKEDLDYQQRRQEEGSACAEEVQDEKSDT